MPPLPRANPLYPGSLFPNALDVINDAPDSVADAIGALQSTVLGSPGAPPVALSGSSITSTGPITVGGVTLLGGTGVPAAGLGANGNFYFRVDGGGAGTTHIYFKNAGAWIGIA
jgi:hypothetical protein